MAEERRRQQLEWTPTAILHVFADFTDYHGYEPRAGDLRKEHGLPAYRTVVANWGSLRSALREMRKRGYVEKAARGEFWDD